MTDRSVIAYPAILHFSESRHYIREVSPANTMANDTLPPVRIATSLRIATGILHITPLRDDMTAMMSSAATLVVAATTMILT
jgi:hypothetical protein